MVVFAESAFKHGYDEEDFFEVLERGPLKLRSRRGLEGVYELYGQNYAGDYLRIATAASRNATWCFTCAQ
jgi:hypothetical protein